MKKKSATKETSKKTAEQKGKKDFLVVGIGASSGGVKALQEFFAAMPANSGMAFVVVLHLSPQHESSLPQILQAQTAMTVIQVRETHKVQPDHIYVISPNSRLEMFDGVIRCLPPERKIGTRVAIDVFLRTLGEAYQRNAVCIIMSGSGSDGTLGLKSIKESNGFAIVQAPEDAEYDQMPRSAIATGLVDWILPVRQIPEKLINFRESSERMHLTNGADSEQIAKEIHAEDSLREILTILRVRTGHDFTNYKRPTLIRRIARHLQIHELTDIPSYLTFLRDNPDEVLLLQRNLLINVTNFFRDREAFKALETEVVPKLFAGKNSRDMIRVWTAGCASGEEAYSVAMILSEYAETLSDPPKFQIFATDVDDEAISQAREHHYPETIEADVSPERLKRFFTRDGSEYRIKKELRETILFAPHNILRDPPFSRLDLITCRNLLIYLNREAQERVMEIFRFALLQNGFLFLGSSESAESSPEMFDPVNKKQRIYQRRVAAHSYHAPPKLPISGNWQVNLPEAKKISDRIKVFSLGEVHYKLLENFAPPSVLVNHDFDVVYMSESVGRFLRFAGGEPSNNLLKLVNEDLLADLRAALFTAQRERQSTEFPYIRTNLGGIETFVNLSVRVVDVDNYGGDFLLVIFDEAKDPKAQKKPKTKAAEKNANTRVKQDAMTSVVERLEEDLYRTKANLRATIEQHEVSIEELKASNEELQAINEELRSASEELETSKEELQSVNEELTTVNHELKEKIDETTRANSDLQNLIVSTDIATIFLDRNLLIKRYAPLIEQLFNIKPTDIGRPLEHFTHHLNYENLVTDAEQVLKTLKTVEREIPDKNGRHYLTRFSPYRTIDDRINGVVLNFIDITERKQIEQALRINQERMQGQKEALQSATDGASLADSLNILTRLVDKELAGEARTAFYIIDADGTCLHPILGAGTMSEGYLKAMEGFPIGENSVACGLAIPIGKPIVTPDVNEEPRWKPLLGTAKKYDVRGCWSFPIKTRDNLDLGTFAMYFRTPREASSQELVLADIITQSAAVIISKYAETQERERAERAAVLSETKYHALFNSIDEGFAIIEVIYGKNTKPLDYRIIQANEAFTAHSGIENPEGKLASELMPGVEKFWNEIYARVAESGVTERQEIHSKVFNRWFDVSVSRFDGLSRCVVVAFFDITERKQIEQSLRESEERLRIAIDAADMATWTWDLRKDEVYWNEKHFTLFGLEPRENPQSPDLFFKYVHPQDRDWVRKRLEKAIKTNKTFFAEFCIIREDGESRWMEGYGQVVKTVKNKAVKMSGVMSDITERKRVEIALRESQNRLELLMESVKDYAIMTTDINGIVLDWNKGAENIFGWKPEEIIGKSSDIIFTSEDRVAEIPQRERQIALQKGHAEDERLHLRKDGSQFFVSGMMTPLKNGEIEGFVKIARDQTAKMRAEKDKQEAETLRRIVTGQEAERRRLARDVHDHFGQQLTALRLKLDTVRKGSNNRKIAADIEEAQNIARNLDADVDFIAWELRPAALDDLGLLITLQNFVREWAHHTGIRAEFHTAGLSKKKLSFETETNLYRIAQEALNNIYKHAKASQADIILEKRKNELVLIIEDNGIGFDAKNKRLREKGMGLSGMSERAGILGGKLDIESTKNGGTAIFARVPLKLAD